MYSLESLPPDYQPLASLEVCSNFITGGGHLALWGKSLPMLVGRGRIPKVWLQAPTAPKSSQLIALVEASVAVHPAVSVRTEGEDLVVRVGDGVILRVRSESEESAKITEINLKPIGLNLVGDAKELRVGGMTMSSSTFSGVAALVKIGED